MEIASNIGIGILLLLMVFVLNRKKKYNFDYLLICAIMLFASMLYAIIDAQNGYTKFNFLLLKSSEAFFYPVLVLCGLLLIDYKIKQSNRYVWIFSYASLLTIFIITDLLINEYSNEAQIIALTGNPPKYYQWLYIGDSLFITVMLLWFLVKINQYQKRIKDHYSNIEPVNLNWLRQFAITIICLSSLSLVFLLASSFGFVNSLEEPIEYTIIGVVALLIYLGYHGIKYYALSNFKEIQRFNSYVEEDEKTELNNIKYKSSSLSSDEMHDLFNKIKNLFEERRFYLEPQLKIEEIAKELDVTTHKISQTINSITGKSFYDFVNNYRIIHLQNLLKDPNNEKYTILALGIDSGFNSKASMNRVFRQEVGQSPSEYRKSVA